MRWGDLQSSKKVKNNALYLYHSGSEDFSTAKFHSWDTDRIPSSNFLKVDGGERIYLHVNCSGYYRILFECSFNASTESKIFVSGEAVEGAISEGNSNQITIIHYLNTNDYIEVQSDGGNSIAETCRMIVEKIE